MNEDINDAKINIDLLVGHRYSCNDMKIIVKAPAGAHALLIVKRARNALEQSTWCLKQAHATRDNH